METMVNASVKMPHSNYTHADLVETNEARAITLIPVMLVLVLYMAVGLVGNSLACYVIGFRLKASTQNFFIVCLAAFDLTACLLSIPADISDLRFSYTFTNLYICKAMKFSTFFTIIASATTLLVVAIDRHRKICQHFKSQMTLTQAKLCLIPIIGVSTALSIFSAHTSGIAPIRVSGKPNLYGTQCDWAEETRRNNLNSIQQATLVFGFLIVCSVIIILYSCILFTIRKHKRKFVYRQSKGVFVSEEHEKEGVENTSYDVKNSEGRNGRKKRLNCAHSLAQKTATYPKTGHKLRIVVDSFEEEAETAKVLDESIPSVENVELGNINCKAGATILTKQFRTPLGDHASNQNFVLPEQGLTCSQSYQHKEQGLASCQKTDLQDQGLALGLAPIQKTNQQDQGLALTTEQITKIQDQGLAIASNRNTSLQDQNLVLAPNQNIKKQDRNLAYTLNCNICTSPGRDESVAAQTKQAVPLKTTTKTAGRQGKTTRITFVVTLVFILSFVPHLCLQSAKLASNRFTYKLDGASLVLFEIFVRSYYINSIANPFIYNALNPKFKQETRRLWMKAKRLCV